MELETMDQTTTTDIPETLPNCQASTQNKPAQLLPAPGVLTSSLLDDAATEAMAAICGTDCPPREALRRQIQINVELLASGDSSAMIATLSRQATALELGMHGLLVAMAKTKLPDHRMALAKAAATLHGAALRSLSAIQQVSHEQSARRVT